MAMLLTATLSFILLALLSTAVYFTDILSAGELETFMVVKLWTFGVVWMAQFVTWALYCSFTY